MYMQDFTYQLFINANIPSKLTAEKLQKMRSCQLTASLCLLVNL